jgi:urease accessory protein
MDVTVDIGEHARFVWLPEPTIAVCGADHRASMTLSLAPQARVAVGEVLVLGRYGEEPGSITSMLRVDRDAWPVLRTELSVGPRWPAGATAAVAGDHRVVAHLFLAGFDPVVPRRFEGLEVGVARLEGGEQLVTAVGASAEAVRRAFEALISAAASQQPLLSSASRP